MKDRTLEKPRQLILSEVSRLDIRQPAKQLKLLPYCRKKMSLPPLDNQSECRHFKTKHLQNSEQKNHEPIFHLKNALRLTDLRSYRKSVKYCLHFNKWAWLKAVQFVQSVIPVIQGFRPCITITIIARQMLDIAETNMVVYTQNDVLSKYINMIKYLRFTFSFSMKKVHTKFINYSPGPPQKMFIDEREIQVAHGQLLLKVKALGINRAECLHRQGKYKINRPVQSFLGLQAAGQVYDPQTNQKLYDGIALLTGGSYAQWASLPSSHILPLPKSLNFIQGGAIPQAWLTGFQLLRLAQVKVGDHVVIYAGASGVGTAVIQLGKLLGAHIWCVVSTKQKGQICESLGASGVVYYKNNPNWAKELLQKRKQGFNAVLDCVGADNSQNTLELLSLDGKWILFGLLSGAKCNMNLASIIGKRISLISTTLKTRSDEYKAQLVQDFRKTALEGFDNGKLKPIIYKTFNFNWSSAQPFVQAHKLMESNANVGKIMIQFNQ